MKSDSLEDALKKRLQDYTPAQSVPSWQQMQRRMQLHANAHPELEIRPKRSLGRRLGYGTAAALLLIAAGIGVYRSGLPSLQDIPEQTYTASGGDKAQLPAPAKGNDPVLAKLLQSAAKIEVITPQADGSATTVLAANTDSHSGASDMRKSAAPDPASETTVSDRQASPQNETAAKTVAPKRLADHSRLFDTPDPQKRRPRHGWIASAFANASTFSSAASGSGPTPTRLTSLLDGNSSFAYTKGGVPEFGRGNMDHKFPVSVGLNVRKYLAPRLGIETGLVYSYLSSQAEIEGAFSYRYSQKVHYLGIPLSLTYSVLDNKRFDIYFIGGFMAEKAIAARGTTKIYDGSTLVSSVTDKLSAKGLFWSAHLGTGVSYNFADHFGLFVQPEISYYFRNDRQPLSYRTENRWNVNLRMGLRYNF